MSSHLQFLSQTLESVFIRFKCSDLVNAEYKRRATTQRVNNAVSRSSSTFCVFKEYREIDGVEHSKISIEKYSNELNCFKEILDISVGKREWFEVVLDKNRIFVLGGCESMEASKSVSNMKRETELWRFNSLISFEIPHRCPRMILAHGRKKCCLEWKSLVTISLRFRSESTFM